MSFSDEPLIGKFVWHDLITDDVEGELEIAGLAGRGGAGHQEDDGGCGVGRGVEAVGGIDQLIGEDQIAGQQPRAVGPHHVGHPFRLVDGDSESAFMIENGLTLQNFNSFLAKLRGNP